MSGRDTVLGAVRNALTDVPRSENPGGPPPPHGHRNDHTTGPDNVALFSERTAEYRATVVRVPAARAAAAVQDALARTGARSLVVPPGLPADLIPEGPWALLEDTPPLTPGQLDAADAVLTTSATAIAVTGTVILDHGPGQGRRALTLLPDQHICLVREDQIAPDVPGSHLLHVLREFETFYNCHRPHRALNLAAPLRSLPEPISVPAQSRYLEVPADETDSAESFMSTDVPRDQAR